MIDFVLYVLLTLFVILFFRTFRRKERKGKVIPGPKGLPFLGKALEVAPDTIHTLFSQYAREYGDIVQIKIASDTLVILNTFELLHKAFKEEPYKMFLNDKPECYYGRTFIKGSKSLGFTPSAFDGAHSVMSKSFIKAFRVYGDGIEVFEENILREIKALTEQMDQMEGQDIELLGIIKRSVTGVMAYLLSGHNMVDDDFEVIWDLNSSIEALLNFHNNAILNTFPFMVRIPGYYKTIYDRCHAAKEKLLKRYFWQIKESHQHNEVRGMVDFFLDEQQRETESGEHVVWTDDQIIGNVLDIFAAGTLTTSSAITSTILCLMHHPEYQTRVQEELDGVLGRNRPPVLNDRPHCPFLEATIMETTRIIPPLPMMQIHTSKEDLAFEGYHLPANSMVIPNAWHILHDETVWGDPWKFRPERFLDDSGELLPVTHQLRQQWIPFGLGRRKCIAEQFARSRLFLFMASLLHRYKFTPTPGKGGAWDPRSGNFDFTVVCRSKPFYCQIERRHKSK